MESSPSWTDIATVILAGLGILLAYIESQSWKRKLSGQAEYEVARKIMECALRLRLTLASLRNPSMFGHEMRPDDDSKEKQYDPLDEREHVEALARGYDRRLKTVNDALTDFRTALIQGEAIWDDLLKDPSALLFEAYTELAATLVSWIDVKRTYADRTRGMSPGLSKSMEDWEKVVHARKGDEFDKKLQAGIDSFKEKLKPKLLIDKK